MKKLVLTFFLALIFSSTNAANILLDVEVKDTQNNPIPNLVINQSSGVWSNKFLITDDLWQASATFEYDAQDTELLSFLINGNRISITGANGGQESVYIVYNIEEQLIDSVNYNGGFTFKNQELTKSSNYYGLISYIFFTLILATILVVSRVFYMKAHIDIVKHNQKKIHM